MKSNCVTLGNGIDFAGTQLQLKSGTSYIYEGEGELTKGETISSNTVDLSLCAPNKDLFAGSGNANWTLTSSTGKYFIQIDAFSGSSYGCNLYVWMELGAFPSRYCSELAGR